MIVLWQLLKIYLLAVTLGKVLKVLAIIAIIASANYLVGVAVDSILDYIDTWEDPVVLGQTVIIVAWISWVGIDDALTIILGAHLSVFTIRMVFKTMGWV